MEMGGGYLANQKPTNVAPPSCPLEASTVKLVSSEQEKLANLPNHRIA